MKTYRFMRSRVFESFSTVIKPGGREISMTIGEPKHSFPEWVTDIIVKNSKGFNDYPSNEGIPELKEAIVSWVQRRYNVSLDPQKIYWRLTERERVYIIL